MIGPVKLYRNIRDGTVQQADPTPAKAADALPDGWTKEFDEDGDVVFVDHNTARATYDTPLPTHVCDLLRQPNLPM